MGSSHDSVYGGGKVSVPEAVDVCRGWLEEAFVLWDVDAVDNDDIINGFLEVLICCHSNEIGYFHGVFLLHFDRGWYVKFKGMIKKRIKERGK